MVVLIDNYFQYTAQQYRESNGRYRWAVLHLTTRTWSFPASYGKRAAERLARQMNKRNATTYLI